jgi:outer membrane autotransporter protein
MVGVSGGIDYRFSDRFVGGFGAGYGRDQTDIGGSGTENRTGAFSAAIYGSYKPVDNLFIDGLLGGSWLDLDSRRFVTPSGDFATGSRSGTQLFGSVSTAYEFRDDAWLVSPYGRVDFSRSWLDGFTESGGGIYGLTYGEQTVDVLSGVLGIRASYNVPMGWGILRPGVRAEYTHDFAGSSRASLGYTDLGGLPYWIELDPAQKDHLTLGLSLDFQFDNDMDLGFNYRTRFGGSDQDHALGMKFGLRF